MPLISRLRAPGWSPNLVGILCGGGAALFWALGFVGARHGIAIGFSPADLGLHRFAWGGLVLLPFMFRSIPDLGGIGWPKGVLLTLLGGPPLAIISYAGFLLVPLGHGGVIQPSSAALFGLLFAGLVLHEKLPTARIAGAIVIVGGVCVIGFEALATIGQQGVLGDLAFVTAGLCFATFAMLLRLWRLPATRATAVVSLVSVLDFPIHWALFGFDRMIALGLSENLLQIFLQGVLAGAGAIFLFTRAVVLLGAARAAVFTSLVPGFTLLIGFVILGEVPTVAQLAGLAIVLVGFRMTQRG